jgi:hypothetical protein
MNGGTGVTPVKFGVAPDFIEWRISWIDERTWSIVRASTISGVTPEITRETRVPPNKKQADRFQSAGS